MKRYLLAATVLLIPITSAYAADLPDEQRQIIDTTNWATNLTQAELFDDLDVWSGSPSEMQISYDDFLRLGNRESVLCTSTKDPNCKDALGLHVRAYLPVCKDGSEQYCIENFFAIRDGIRIEGKFKENYPRSFVTGQFAAEPDIELPAGGPASIWELPGITHSGGTNQFRINAQLFGDLNRTEASKRFDKFNIRQVWSSINAVTEVPSPGEKPLAASRFGGGDHQQKELPDSKAKCIAIDTDSCLLAWPLDQQISLGLTLRMPHSISGWLHGRFDSPSVSTSVEKNGSFRISFQGTPMKVPTVFASIPWEQASTAFKNRFGSVPSGSFGGGNGVSAMESAGRNQSSQQMVDDLNLWLPIIKDRASATPTYWMVRTTTNAETNKQNCLKNGSVNGIVTTNATAYTSGAPFFNEKYQSLDYKVASPHYDANGNVNIGHYNLQINSEVARCLYGFTNAPVSASVSVISSNGENQVATTTLREKDGWIYLSAAGFTYSSPTVRVKLTQKVTITCVKGALTKRVTGSNPKCTGGFKKK